MALQSLWPQTIICRMSLMTQPSSRAAGSQLKYSSWKWWEWGIRLPALRTKTKQEKNKYNLNFYLKIRIK